MDLNGTNVAAPVVPFSTQDIFPTHYAQYGKGGWRSVSTKDDLRDIPSARLEYGMVVYVETEDVAYVYTRKVRPEGIQYAVWETLKGDTNTITKTDIQNLFK